MAEYLPAALILARHDLLRRLALLSLRSQPPRYREDLLAERRITVSREAIRFWCIKFGAIYVHRLQRKHRGYGDAFYIDETFLQINDQQHYLSRAVDQDGNVVDAYLQTRSDGPAAKRFFKRLLRVYGSELRKIVTDKLRSSRVARR
ncbi:DDE-type integrase/transposase/recombinase [Luminiphilus sp.]|nr:DDE-type integrase/transposase/recombinase [Luminiphilus sp.]